jgi:hypothetical protein
MLQKCQKYATAINAKGKSFPTEPDDGSFIETT